MTAPEEARAPLAAHEAGIAAGDRHASAHGRTTWDATDRLAAETEYRRHLRQILPPCGAGTCAQPDLLCAWAGRCMDAPTPHPCASGGRLIVTGLRGLVIGAIAPDQERQP